MQFFKKVGYFYAFWQQLGQKKKSLKTGGGC